MKFFKFLISKNLLLQIGISIVVVIILIFTLKWWLGYTTNHEQKIQVPNLSRLTIEQAKKKLSGLGLQYFVNDSASYNPDFPKRSVLEQDPEAGDFVKEQRKIYLTLNPSKYRDIAIPDLDGMTRRQAETHLRTMGFKVGTDVTWVPDIGKDVVRGLKFNGKQVDLGDKCPKNSEINLILGDGNEE